MRPVPRRLRSAAIAVAIALLVGGAAVAGQRPGLPTPSGVRAECVCHLVCQCKNLLLGGVRLGHRYMRAAAHAALDAAHRAADGARDASGGGTADRRTAP